MSDFSMTDRLNTLKNKFLFGLAGLVCVGAILFTRTAEPGLYEYEDSTDRFISFRSVGEANEWLAEKEGVQILKWEADVAYSNIMLPETLTTLVQKREVYILTILYRQH